MLTRRVRVALATPVSVSVFVSVLSWFLVSATGCTPGSSSSSAPSSSRTDPDGPPNGARSGGASGQGAPASASGGNGASMSHEATGGQPGTTGSGGSGATPGGPGAASDAGSTSDLSGPEPVSDSHDAGAVAPGPGPAGGADPSAFACNLVLGIKQTGEWFSAGFETQVDNARWEVVPVHNGHIELWADPKNGIWGQKPQSPCTQGAAAPDRVIFVGTNYDYTTVEEFLPKYVAVIDNIKAKFASVKRIELMTHIRAPGNKACPGALDFKTFIKPAQDQALEMAVAKYPGLVFASPKFEVDACADYGLYPHFKGGGAAAVGKKVGEFYKSH